jgi:hypothetical protein
MGSIFEIITSVLVVARGAVRGASIGEILSSLFSYSDDASRQKEMHALRFFNHTGTIPAQEIR